MRNNRRAERRLLAAMGRLSGGRDVLPETESAASAGDLAEFTRALAALNQTQRDALLLHAWEGLSHSEIGRSLGVPEGTVASRIVPGDALTVPAEPVPTLLVPVCAPWLKSAEFVDYFRQVNPRRGFAIHDAMLSEFGLMVLAGYLDFAADGREAELARLEPGTTIDL